MNRNLLQHKLLNSARSVQADGSVPYGFQQRLMARLRTEVVLDGLTLWARALWRASAPCALIMLVFVVWPTLTPEAGAQQETEFGQQLEAAVFAAVPSEGEFAW
jgi:hypothetical protein